MITCVAPVNEAARLAAVEAVAWPRGRTDSVLDDIAGWAADHFATPIAVISLIERDTKIVIAAHGVGRVSTPRENSLCAHAVSIDETLVVPDAASDPRFEANPFVVNAPNVRFYAGALLRSADGQPIGTLCVVDSTPRANLGDAARTALERLARFAEQRLQAYVLERRLAAAMAARADAEADARNVRREAAGAFIACDRLSHNLEGRVRAGLMRVQREISRVGAQADAELAALSDIVEELAIAARLDRLAQNEAALFEPGAMVRAIVSDVAPYATKRGVELSLIDDSSGAEMLGDSWRFEELIEAALSACIASAQGALRVECRFESSFAGPAQLMVRISAEHCLSPLGLSARNRELIDAMGGCWELSGDAGALVLLLPARLRMPRATTSLPQAGGNIVSFDTSRKGSR